MQFQSPHIFKRVVVAGYTGDSLLGHFLYSKSLCWLILYWKRRMQHSVALVCLIRCWSLLSVVSRPVPADSLSSASASIHPSSVAAITTGLILFTLVYFSFNWIQLVGFFHFSPQLAFHLLQHLCLSCGNEPTITFILRATVRFSLCLICSFFLLSVFDWGSQDYQRCLVERRPVLTVHLTSLPNIYWPAGITVFKFLTFTMPFLSFWSPLLAQSGSICFSTANGEQFFYLCRCHIWVLLVVFLCFVCLSHSTTAASFTQWLQRGCF